MTIAVLVRKLRMLILVCPVISLPTYVSSPSAANSVDSGGFLVLAVPFDRVLMLVIVAP
jgi:hypothetical protein